MVDSQDRNPKKTLSDGHKEYIVRISLYIGKHENKSQCKNVNLYVFATSCIVSSVRS